MKKQLLKAALAIGLLSAGFGTTQAQTGNYGIGTATPGSTLTVNGSFAATYNQVTAASYAMTPTDFYVVYNGTGPGAFTLPTSVAIMKGRIYYIKNTTAGQNITITPNGTETIDGNAVINVGAGQSVQIVNTGLTGTNATWEIVSFNSTTATGCTPQYVFAGMSVTQTLTSPTISTVSFNTASAANGIPLNTATGVFTLTAGNTYQLEASLYLSNFSNQTNSNAVYYWADATSGSALPNAVFATVQPTTYSSFGVASQPLTTLIFTPATNQTICVKATTSGTGTVTANINGGYSFATIKQLNACPGGNGSGIITASNGLTATGGNVKLGGTLSAATDVATAGNNLTFSGTGNVGIGTTTPNAKLTVNGSEELYTGTSHTGQFYAGTSNLDGIQLVTSANDAYLGIQRSVGPGLSLAKPAGYTSNVLATFQVVGVAVGSITTTGTAVAYNTTSDVRLKQNITKTHYGLIDLMKIAVKDYDYKSDKDHKAQTGFLAQQLYDVYPVAVTKGGEDANQNPWQVDYSKLTPLLVKATQELTNRVAILEKENAVLRSAAATAIQVDKNYAQLAERMKQLEQMMGMSKKAMGTKIAKR